MYKKLMYLDNLKIKSWIKRYLFFQWNLVWPLIGIGLLASTLMLIDFKNPIFEAIAVTFAVIVIPVVIVLMKKSFLQL